MEDTKTNWDFKSTTFVDEHLEVKITVSDFLRQKTYLFYIDS